MPGLEGALVREGCMQNPPHRMVTAVGGMDPTLNAFLFSN